MRFPPLAQLDREQRAIYTGASPNASIVVKGPPGTGKTVMALHRAAVLARANVEARLIMYNSVLARYTSNGTETVAPGVEVQTMHGWAYKWWRQIRGTGTSKPPTLPNDAWAHDWADIMKRVVGGLAAGRIQARDVDWSHLIVDEGQDFSPDMYKYLTMIASELARYGIAQPVVSVFADENQRLNEKKNATLAEIEEGLNVGGEKVAVYSLRKNYRNTREIGEFAKKFCVNLSTGVPDTPSRTGTKPVIHRAAGIAQVRDYLSRYAINNAGQEVGVLCSSDRLRKQVFNSLASRLSSYDLRVQTYSSKDKDSHPANKLQFDSPDVLTVLNFQSAKGLEFDTVFIVDPFGNVQLGGSGDQQFKMQMYVMCSRARENLEIILLSDPPRPDLLPPPSLFEHNSLA